MTRTRLVVTVASFAVLQVAGLALLRTVEVVGWPTVAALLRAYGL